MAQAQFNGRTAWVDLWIGVKESDYLFGCGAVKAFNFSVPFRIAFGTMDKEDAEFS